jgi:hypothetical protein
MPQFRFFVLLLLPILTVCALLITGAVAQQDVKPAPSAQTAPAARQGASKPPDAKASTPPQAEPKADAKATETLKKAIKELDPDRLGWVDTKVWQQVNGSGISFQAQGRYRSGPGLQLRLDLKVRLGGTGGESLTVSDGAWLWTSTQVADAEPKVTKCDLKKLEATLKSPGMLPQVGEEFYRSQAFRGFVPLLETLSQQMVFTRQETTRWQGHDVLQLTGVWSAEIRKGLTSPQANAPWPPFTPRHCQVYLDQKAPHWLYRIEWLGPTTLNGDDQALMQMEFREPRVFKTNDKLPQDFPLAFHFDPGKAHVLDRTEFLEKTIERAGRPSGPGIRPSTDTPRP